MPDMGIPLVHNPVLSEVFTVKRIMGRSKGQGMDERLCEFIGSVVLVIVPGLQIVVGGQ